MAPVKQNLGLVEGMVRLPEGSPSSCEGIEVRALPGKYRWVIRTYPDQANSRILGRRITFAA